MQGLRNARRAMVAAGVEKFDPYTLHLTPYTLNTLHLTPYTLHPKPYTLNTEP